MGTNCALLLADLFLFCYERDFMMSLSVGNQSEIIEAFNWTSRYLDDLLNIDNTYFDDLISQIYPSELQLRSLLTPDPYFFPNNKFFSYFIIQFCVLFWQFYFNKIAILPSGLPVMALLRTLLYLLPWPFWSNFTNMLKFVISSLI